MSAVPLTPEWYAEWDALLAKPGLPDHADCEGPDCDATICCCPTVCDGAVEQACGHHSLLCGDCAVVECIDCRVDYQDGAA